MSSLELGLPVKMDLVDYRTLLPVDHQGGRKIVPRLRSTILRPLSQGLIDRLIESVNDSEIAGVFEINGIRKTTRVMHRHDKTWNMRFKAMKLLSLVGRPPRPMREFGGEEFGTLPDENWDKGPEPEWDRIDVLNQDRPAPTVGDMT